MNSRRVVRVLFAAGVAAALLGATGCPNPITDQTFLQMTDRNPPTVDVASPTGGTPYTQTVTVQGTAIDAEGRLKVIAWTVTGALGLLEEGDIPASGIGIDGSFSFAFSTLAYTGPVGVTVAATDWNDNVGQATVTLVQPDGQLSSFTATPANKRVTLDWDEVPGATYTVYYTTNGTIPTTSDLGVSPSAPPYELTGLQNGDLHTFLLRARLASGTDYWSGYVKAIPLSEMTLAPRVTGDYGTIDLVWNGIDATNEFVIQRALTPSNPGSWVDYTGVIVGTRFTDHGVNDGTWYYYRVRPALPGSVASAGNGGETFRLPPYEVGSIISLDTPGTPKRLKARGNVVFIAAGTAGLVVVDVADPIAPRVIATYPTTNAKDIELDAAGQFAFIADGTGGLVVVDVSDPSYPTLADSQWWPDVDATAVAVIDAALDYAYILGSEPSSVTRIRTVDVTTRTNVIDLTLFTYTNSSYDFTDVAATVYAGTKYLFLPCGFDDGLLKVRHTTSPLVLIGSAFTDLDYTTRFVAVKPTTSGTDSLYVLSQYRYDLEPPPEYALLAVRISDMAKQGESGIRSGYIADVNLSALGTSAFAADGIGLVSYDLSTPTTPVAATFWNIPGSPVGAASNGPYAFAAAGLLGFHLVNTGMPYAPSLAPWDDPANQAGRSIATRGTTVFMSVGAPSTPGIQAYDVSDPLSPVALGFTPLANPDGIEIAGDYAVVANGSTVKILDIRNPAAPLPEVGSASSRSGSLWSVAVSGDLAFLTGSSFQSFDISDPANPVFRGIHDSDGGGMNGVAARGRTAYVAEGAYFQPNRLKILDLTNPAVPILEGMGATSGMILTSVTLDGSWALIADSFPDVGLWAVNIDPASPSFLATYGYCDVAPGAEQGWAQDVFSYGGWAYVTFDSGTVKGLSVVDVADPTGLGPSSLRSTLLLGGSPGGLVMTGKWGYVANGSLGLQVISVAP